MCTRLSNILYPLTEVASNPKGRKILWNDVLEEYFKELKRMVYPETLFNYSDCIIIFTVHTYAYDKQLGSIISQNNKPNEFLSIILKNPKCNSTTTRKEPFLIM